MPFRNVKIECPDCKAVQDEDGQRVECERCNSTGQVTFRYHYTGDATLPDDVAAALDSLVAEVNQSRPVEIETETEKEAGDDDL